MPFRLIEKNSITPKTGFRLITPAPEQKTSYIQRLTDSYKKGGEQVISAVKSGSQDIAEGSLPAVGVTDTETKMNQIKGFGKILKGATETGLNTVGAIAGAAFAPVTAALEPAIKPIVEKLITIPGVEKNVAKVSEWAKNNPQAAKDLQSVFDIATLGIGGATEKVVKDVAVNTVKKTGQLGKRIIDTTAKDLSGMSDSGIFQSGKEIVERVPRALGKLKENVSEMNIRANEIKQATPEIANAMKSNLDDRIINTVSQADNETKKAFKNVLDIADESPKTIGAKKQPSLVGGELAVKQYDLINKQKKSVGEQIGEITKNLSKTEKINMQDSFGQMDDIIANQGITPYYTKRGVKLDFTGSKYTPAERTKIQELYNLAVEGGDNLTPLQIKNKDQLFSKLKRESNFEGIGDLIVETPEGNKSLFNIFRDIYSNKLDAISPEIKKLNSSYRNLSQITDDIENSILKTPNFNATKLTDQAEFAKVNMRRIFGEAGSSPAFEAVADIMDKASRGLGYKGATPKQVAEFAEYIRKLYPESIPKTGFQGGIKMGVNDIIEKVSKIGTPDLIDQRKALRELLKRKELLK